MKRLIVGGAALVGGAVALRLLPQIRRRFAGTLADRMHQRMELMLAKLPEESPPKLVMSVLPRLRDQNEQIIAMLREQNELLREHLTSPHASMRQAS